MKKVHVLLSVVMTVIGSMGMNAAAECKQPDSAKQTAIVTYIMKKYQISSSSNLTLAASAKANDACFWKIQYVATNPKRTIDLYLSPDQKYLSPVLYDISLDPLAEMKAENDALTKELLDGANPGRGSASAPVTIVEFSDFECPYCKRMTDALESGVLPKQGDKVRVVFRNYPLPMHPWAKSAAEIAECAALQKPDAFWAIHDFFFQNQQTLNLDDVKSQTMKFAATIKGLDQQQFESCVNHEFGLGPVTQDQQLGQKMGVTGTPALFINGVRFDGARSADEVNALIEQAARGELVAPPQKVVQPTTQAAALRNTAAAECAPAPIRAAGGNNVQ
jgi:protein-disulfide isomerase